MPAPNDAAVTSMTEYHQRYSRGQLIHRGWEAYCRDCGRGIDLPSDVITRQQARQRLLDVGWLPEKIAGYDLERWLCPCCLTPFLCQGVADASTK